MRRSSRITRQSTSALAKGTATTKSIYAEEKENEEAIPRKTRVKRTLQSLSDALDTDAEEYVEPETTAEEPHTKRRKVTSRSTGKKKNGNANANAQLQLHERVFGKLNANPTSSSSPPSTGRINFPNRTHDLSYHRPLLLDSREARTALLTWFDSVSTARNMPWRKPWIDPRSIPDEALRRQRLERRAYEVWISEIMLQQTRVAVVIDYWNRWMARWPTIHDLAAAMPDDVLAAWRGLGYYSRATRIHDAAKIVCGDEEMSGLLPEGVEDLVKKVPGVGRYTAGAISAIVFGRAAPMVDGNVLRVLSRQMGVLGDVKGDKAVVDVLWAAAERLVKAIARDGSGEDDTVRDAGEDGEEEPSDRPGRWGQALMELGSTVCTPKPNCAVCPITSTCRAYGEGLQLATGRGIVPNPSATKSATLDIEDACTLCKPFEEFAEDDDEQNTSKVAKVEESKKEQKSKTGVQATLQSFAFTQTTTTKSKRISKPDTTALSAAAVDVIANHARKFPVKTVKKAVREEETLVCAIKRSDGRYLIHRRPEKGLLAGLWELPSAILVDPQDSTAKTRKKAAEKYVSGLVRNTQTGVKHVGELGSVPWLFSHLKLTMHVHLFELDGCIDNEGNEAESGEVSQSRWSDAIAIDEESMGTGMRKCWALVKEASEDYIDR
ncbi:DNA glycosylase [Hypoxylon sp. NC0597]|nr:DNA glycosylase [Hypoxylon sp. NC0597]